jgi:predicted transglutaminase-like cysteine proteinase
MREHLIAKQIAIATPSEHTADGLRRAEIGLFDCQDYDIYQKRLMQLGLTENELSLMRLRAIEARADTLHEVVATHEIRY